MTRKKKDVRTDIGWSDASSITLFVGSIEGATNADFAALAQPVVKAFHAQKRIVSGMGHPFHKPIDPRATAHLRPDAAQD
jgi:citrate synthase